MEEPRVLIQAYLQHYRRLVQRRRSAETGWLAGLWLAGALFLILTFEYFFGLITRAAGLSRGLLAAPLAVLLVQAFLERRRLDRLEADRLALELERRFPHFRNHLINAYQLGRRPKGYPAPFVNRLLGEASGMISIRALDELPVRPQAGWYRKGLLAAAAGLLILSLAAPGPIRSGFLRLLAPWAGPGAWGIRVEPGDCLVVRGSDLEIRALPPGNGGPPRVEFHDGPGGSAAMEAGSAGWYRHRFETVREPFTYRVRAGRGLTPWFRVQVQDPTFLKRFKIACRYPAYTGLAAAEFEQEPGDLTFPAGTRLTLEAVFNNPVGATWLVLGSRRLGHSGRRAAAVRRFELTVESATLYEFHFYDYLARDYRVSPRFRLQPGFDQAPVIEFTLPAHDVSAAAGASVRLEVRASDDYGLRKVRFRIRSEGNDRPEADPVFFQAELSGRREGTASAYLKLPAGFSEPIAYYAEALDNQPAAPNLGRSSLYHIYPASGRSDPSGRRGREGEENRPPGIEVLKELAENLKQFAEEQRKLLEAAKRLDKPQDLRAAEKAAELARVEREWAELFQKMVDDLNKINQQTKGKFTMAEELVEMISHLQKAAEALPHKPVHMVIPESMAGLELAEELTANLERWMAEEPDYLKWDMAEPSNRVEAPEAELPDELMDIVGDLLEQEADMKEEIEDITSSWMDSMDKGAGWTAMDGPISNMSAKGITGNLMPNQHEVGGRAGEGRTGRSYGEMVEETAVGKGGRRTPARLTPDNREPGEIKDSSRDNPLGPTGGGKTSGWGSEGLQGPVQDLNFRYDRLADRQARLVEEAEKLERKLQVLNVSNPQLEQALASMRNFQVQLNSGRYEDLLTTKQLIISNLQQVQQSLVSQTVIRLEGSERSVRRNRELRSAWEDRVPAGYEGLVQRYYRDISGE